MIFCFLHFILKSTNKDLKCLNKNYLNIYSDAQNYIFSLSKITVLLPFFNIYFYIPVSIHLLTTGKDFIRRGH